MRAPHVRLRSGNRVAKGRYREHAARRFEAECGRSPGAWHCRWNTENEAPDESVIPGRRGQVYPWGPSELGVYVGGPNATHARKVLHQHPDWTLVAEGDVEMVFVVPIEQLDEAAGAVKAYRQRRLSADARSAAIKNLRIRVPGRLFLQVQRP